MPLELFLLCISRGFQKLDADQEPSMVYQVNFLTIND